MMSGQTSPDKVAGEFPLRVFISSVMDDELAPVRASVVEAIGRASYLKPWAFEYTPASSESTPDNYLNKVAESDFVIWLAGSRTTQPVADEIRTALRSDRRLLVFRLPADERDKETESLLGEVGAHTKWTEVSDISRIADDVHLAVNDEIVRAVRYSDQYGDRPAELEILGRQSRARIIARCQASGLSFEKSVELADDPRVGEQSAALVNRPQPYFTLISGDMGVGKSLAAERLLQRAIAESTANPSAARPVYLHARDATGTVNDAISRFVGAAEIADKGVALVLDGIDEIDIGRARELLLDALELASVLTSGFVVATSRARPEFIAAELVTLVEPMELGAALDLVGWASDREPPSQYSLPPDVREAIRRPLFSLFLARALVVNDGRLPASRADLVRTLVEAALGSEPIEALALPALRRLGALTLDRGGGAVPTAEVAEDQETRASVIGSRLVAAEGGQMSFPLRILAEWFASESLASSDGPTISELTSNTERLARWTGALTIAAGTHGYEKATELLQSIAEKRPYFVGRIIEASLPEYSDSRAQHLESEIIVGRRIRSATSQLLGAVGDARSFTGLYSASGDLHGLGISIRSGMVETAWMPIDEAEADVSELSDVLPLDPAWNARWTSFIGGPASEKPAWPWRRAFDYVVDPTSEVVSRRLVVLTDNEPMASEAMWEAALMLTNRGGLSSAPTPIDEVLEAIENLSPGAHPLRPGRRGSLSVGNLRILVQEAQKRDLKEIEPPWPTATGPPRGPFVWSTYTPHELLLRARAIFSGAIEIYMALVQRLFAPLAPGLTRAALHPFVIEGSLSAGKNTWREGEWPDITWILSPLEVGEAPRVDFEIGRSMPSWLEADINADRLLLKRRRPAAPPWVGPVRVSQFLDILDPKPATKLAYSWLFDDLKTIAWVRGVGPSD